MCTITNNTSQGELIAPLRRVNMKGILHYPIKDIFQSTYTDLVIIAKYEGKKKKDKVKVIEVKWNWKQVKGIWRREELPLAKNEWFDW